MRTIEKRLCYSDIDFYYIDYQCIVSLLLCPKHLKRGCDVL